MLPLLIVLGATGAVLELKRLVARPSSDDDSFKFQQNEEKLKRILQEVQRELQQEKVEHRRHQDRAEELERVAAELRAAHAELVRKGREFEQTALGLTKENSDLLLKVEELQAQHQEALKQNWERFQDELDALKREVASAFEAFTEGHLSAESLLEKLTDLGVEVELTEDDLRALPKGSDDNDGSQSVRQVELQVDSDWRSHLRLLTDDPERMARHLVESAHKAALPTNSAPNLAFPAVRTPPRERKDGSIFSKPLAMSMFSPQNAQNEKENQGAYERLQPGNRGDQMQLVSGHHDTEASIAQAAKPLRSAQRKPPTPTRKKHHQVPRLGLSVVLRGDQPKSGRDTFPVDSLIGDADEQHMMGHHILRR